MGRSWPRASGDVLRKGGAARYARPEVHEVRRHRRFDDDAFGENRMVEGEAARVQGVAIELEASAVVVGERLVGAAREKLGIGPVELVSHDRAAHRRQMHADLVLAARFEIASQERIGAVLPLRAREDFEARPSGEAATSGATLMRTRRREEASISSGRSTRN